MVWLNEHVQNNYGGDLLGETMSLIEFFKQGNDSKIPRVPIQMIDLPAPPVVGLIL